MRPIWRTGLGLLLAPWLVLSSVVAPEHVHEADADHSAVAHRHFAPHDHDGSEFDHDEGRVLWLDDVALQQAIYQFAVTLGVGPANVGALPNPTSWIVVSTLDGAPPHGPPRSASSLRGPPCPPA
jgi:hypothetical protein